MVDYSSNLESSYKYIHSVPKIFLVEKKYNENIEQFIVFEEDILVLLEKQIKSVAATESGLLNQVTMHISEESNNKNLFTQFMSKIVPHKDLLAIEDLSPVYIKSSGSLEAILISMF